MGELLGGFLYALSETGALLTYGQAVEDSKHADQAGDYELAAAKTAEAFEIYSGLNESTRLMLPL